MVGLMHPNYCTHSHGKQSKTLSSRLVNVWNKHQKKFSLNQVQQGSEILNFVQTQNWACGLVLHNHRTLDRTVASLSVGVYIWTVQSVPHKGFSLIDWPLICPWCHPWGTLLSIPFGPLQTVESSGRFGHTWHIVPGVTSCEPVFLASDCSICKDQVDNIRYVQSTGF